MADPANNNEPQLPWLKTLPIDNRFYGVVAGMALLVLLIFTAKQSLDGTAIYVIIAAIFIIIIVTLGMVFRLSRTRQNETLDIERVSRRIENIELSLGPIIKDFDTIRDLVMEYAISSQNDPQQLLMTAKRQLMNQQADKSILTLNILSGIEENNPRVYSNLSYAYERKDEILKALSHIDKAIDLATKTNGDIARYKFHRARYLTVLAQNGDDQLLWKRAMTDFREACSHTPSYLAKASLSTQFAPLLNRFAAEGD